MKAKVSEFEVVRATPSLFVKVYFTSDFELKFWSKLSSGNLLLMEVELRDKQGEKVGHYLVRDERGDACEELMASKSSLTPGQFGEYWHRALLYFRPLVLRAEQQKKLSADLRDVKQTVLGTEPSLSYLLRS